MKVLLVGGLGFIGRRFIRKYSNIHEIIVYATRNDIEKSRNTLQLDQIKIEEGSIEETRLIDVTTRHKPDVVIHLAALTGLKKCHENPELAFKINVYGTYNVIHSCLASKSKLIFISSREVYGETNKEESDENDPLIPKNIYGLTKMLGENMISYEAKHGLDFTTLRLTNVYGPEGDQYGAQVIINDAIKHKKIKILGGGQRLNYVYVDDVVDFMNSVLDDNRSSNQVFNVGSTDTLKIEEFADKVVKAIGTKIEIEYLPMRETETMNFKPSLNKARKVLGLSTKTSIDEGIQKTIQWYTDH